MVLTFLTGCFLLFPQCIHGLLLFVFWDIWTNIKGEKASREMASLYIMTFYQMTAQMTIFPLITASIITSGKGYTFIPTKNALTFLNNSILASRLDVNSLKAAIS